MKIFKRIKWSYVVLSVMFLLLGIYLVVNPETSLIMICRILGAAMAVFGVMKIVLYFIREVEGVAIRFDFAVGLFCIILGALMLWRAPALTDILSVMIGLLVLVDSVFKLQVAVDSRRMGAHSWWVTLVCTVVCLVLGVLLYLYMEHRGLAMPEKTDQVFSLVAVGGGLPLVVGVLFVIGLISSTYSAAGSALTALTTSFTVDILEGTKRYGEARLTRIRRGVHVAMALGMALVILAFGYLADDSVINLVYKVASYTYGPILGMFVFGMFTRLRVRDRWMPLVAVAAPVLSGFLQWWALEAWDYRIGFELLIYNALFTVIGMLLLVKRHEK